MSINQDTSSHSPISWLSHQAEHMVLTWEKSLERFYPQYVETWTNPAAHLHALTQEWNLLAAVEDLDWSQYLEGNTLKVVDLGAGTGWLSILLSKYENVEEIYAIDSSPNNLKVMLPAITQLMKGNSAKIKPILGLFTPILVPDNFFDLAVASSAVHHAPDLTEILSEVYRVIKPGGFFLILNEQPLSPLYYSLITIYRCLKILRTVALQQWRPIPKPVSEAGLILDPFLGDQGYGYWQWQRAIQSAGFSLEVIKTPYYPYPKRSGWLDPKLTHFAARKALC